MPLLLIEAAKLSFIVASVCVTAVVSSEIAGRLTRRAFKRLDARRAKPRAKIEAVK